MRVALIASHAWPIPNAARTGDIYVLDLAKGLEALGHDVTMFAPEGTAFGKLHHAPCAFGRFAPHALEHETLAKHRDELRTFDIVHDHSTSKVVALSLSAEPEPRKVCMTLTGGPWRDPLPPVNLCVFSKSQRGRVLRGATDYEGTPTPDMGGPPGFKVENAHVVRAGVDTEFYCPSDYAKDDYVLWLNRWHPVKGYELAIRIAKETGMRLVMAGVHPDDATNDHERTCALEAQHMAKGIGNIDFLWLPGDKAHDVHKRQLYRRARALIYPVQFQEPFGLSMVEAMACGTPVVGSRMGSVPEIVDAGVTGDIVSLDADVVQRFADRARWLANCFPHIIRAEAVKRFSREAMASAYVAEYEKILAGESW